MVNDIRTAWLSQFIQDETRRLGLARQFFLNRNDSFKRDYGSTNDTEAKVNPPATLVGGPQRRRHV